MYINQKRLLKLLGTIVAVLVVLLVIVNLVKKHNAEEKQEAASAAAANTVTDGDAQYTAMVYSNGTATLSFAQDEAGNWYWADDPSFPLDQDYILKIVNTITGLHPQQTITGGDALEDYGLAEPAMTITATSDSGDALTLNLGSQVTGGSGSYYLYISGEEDTIYVVSNTLASQLELGIYDMMQLPELPAIPEERFNTITVQGAAETTLTAYVDRTPSQAGSSSADAGTEAQEAAVTWRSAGADVTDNEDVQGLISTMSALTLTRCEDYAPSDEAVSICGFDSPTAAVTAEYLDDGGEEQALTLLVGKLTAAEDGYYVRINDDTTIYSMTEDALSAVLSVAAGGLAA